ncbi:MAG: imelysin family protein [Hyphomicrobiaceae bacterium]
MTDGYGQSFNHTKLAGQARKAFIVPAYTKLDIGIANLSSSITTLCASPSQTHLQATRLAFRKAIAAWGRAEIITFGPVVEQNRFERLFFWPDRRGIGQRQLRRILYGQSPNVLEPRKLANKSVAVQGFTALESLLHGKQANELTTSRAHSFRCRFAHSITRNLAWIVAQILEAWSDDGAFTKLWMAPGPSNPVYLSAPEVTLELVKVLDQTLLNVRERRIVPAIGFGRNRRVFRPVLWRSGLGMVLIDGNLRGVRELFENGGLAEIYLANQIQSDPSSDSAIASLKTEFKFLLNITGELATLGYPFKRQTTRNRLIAIGFPLKSIRMDAVARIKRAAGLSIGFNASDGD